MPKKESSEETGTISFTRSLASGELTVANGAIENILDLEKRRGRLPVEITAKVDEVGKVVGYAVESLPSKTPILIRYYDVYGRLHER